MKADNLILEKFKLNGHAIFEPIDKLTPKPSFKSKEIFEMKKQAVWEILYAVIPIKIACNNSSAEIKIETIFKNFLQFIFLIESKNFIEGVSKIYFK